MKINKPSLYNPYALNNYKSWEFLSKNINNFLIDCISKNKYLSEGQILKLCEPFYSRDYISSKLRGIPQIKRKQTKNPKTGRQIFVYYI